MGFASSCDGCRREGARICLCRNLLPIKTAKDHRSQTSRRVNLLADWLTLSMACLSVFSCRFVNTSFLSLTVCVWLSRVR